MEDDDNDESGLECDVEEPPVVQSYLPSWVLKMRDKIANSRTSHADAELRLEELSKGVDSLSLKLSKMNRHTGKVLPKLLKKPAAQDGKSQHKTAPALFSVPREVFNIILQYLRLNQIAQLDMVNKPLRNMMSTCTYWSEALALYCPHLLGTGNPSAMEPHLAKLSIQKYLHDVKICTKFIQSMKDQRCVPKHRSVQPHRHTRHEKQVTHPLPVFQHSHSAPTSSALLGTMREGAAPPQRNSYWGSLPPKEDMIMSHADTLSTDFRSVAHKALQTLLTLTTDTADPIFHKLLSDGVVTVLASLLSNEEGALQNYACSILANLLCWGARNMPQSGNAATASVVPSMRELRAVSALFSMTVESTRQTVSVATQVTACDGLKRLTALLTSPTAAINIAHSGVRSVTGASAGAGAGVSGNGGGGSSHLRGTTSNIQGMCNKQASRALIALLYPAMPIPLPLAESLKNNPSSRSNSSSSPSKRPEVPGPTETSEAKSPNKVLLQPLASVTQEVVPEHLRTPAIGSLFLCDPMPRPWQFTYFYKSGALKDEFTAYLLFTSSADGAQSGTGVRGRGVDAIGTFTLAGHAEAEISGWSWYIHKSYISTDAANAAMPINDAVPGDTPLVNAALERWLYDVEGVADPPGASRALSVHVSHVGYWSPGAEDSREGRASDGAGQSDRELWGVGLWGVWETSSGTGSHFELQKGGVFRAAPLLLLG